MCRKGRAARDSGQRPANRGPRPQTVRLSRRTSFQEGERQGFKRKGLAASTSAKPSSFMVAEVGFEPTTAALEWMGSDPLRPDQGRHEVRLPHLRQSLVALADAG